MYVSAAYASSVQLGTHLDTRIKNIYIYIYIYIYIFIYRHGFGEWPCGCAGMVVTGWVRIYHRADSSVGTAMGLLTRGRRFESDLVPTFPVH